MEKGEIIGHVQALGVKTLIYDEPLRNKNINNKKRMGGWGEGSTNTYMGLRDILLLQLHYLAQLMPQEMTRVLCVHYKTPKTAVPSC